MYKRILPFSSQFLKNAPKPNASSERYHQANKSDARFDRQGQHLYVDQTFLPLFIN